MAIQSLSSNKLRSILAILGIMAGVASVITTVSVAQGVEQLRTLQLEAMGADHINVTGSGGQSQDWSSLESLLEQDERVSGWSPLAEYTPEEKSLRYRSKILTDENSYTYLYFGNESYGHVMNCTITAGRDLNLSDCENRAHVCVIGDTLRRYFFGAMDPVGEKLRIGNRRFEIVGVYKGKYEGKLNTADQMLVMPYTLRETMMRSAPGGERQYIIRTTDGKDIVPLTEELRTALSPLVEAGGSVSVSSEVLSQQPFRPTEHTVTWLLGITGIALLAGGIGIMNIMLLSVTARKQEIGIRMAIGARRRDIMRQFLAEASVVSCLGGLTGIITGCLLSVGLGQFMLLRRLRRDVWVPLTEPFILLPAWWLLVGAFVFSALLGILFGLYPAGRACRLQPADALRTV